MCRFTRVNSAVVDLNSRLRPGQSSGGFGDSLDEEPNVILLGIKIQKIESQPSFPAEANRREPGISRGRYLRCNPRLQFVCSLPASAGD